MRWILLQTNSSQSFTDNTERQIDLKYFNALPAALKAKTPQVPLFISTLLPVKPEELVAGSTQMQAIPTITWQIKEHQ